MERTGNNDYVLKPSEHSAWVSVGEFSIYILRQPKGGVRVEITLTGEEADPDAVIDYAQAQPLNWRE